MPRPVADPDPTPDARAVAHEVLVRVETTDAFAEVLLADRLAADRLGARDRSLATRLVYGTLAWQGRLDHDLGALLRTPLGGLDPPVRAALRLGLYQLRFLDRVPAHAAVDTSVRLARRASGPGAGGLVNAVLRRAVGTHPPLPDDPLERLAVEFSHPRWLVERWAREIGSGELARLLGANNDRAPTVIRANRLRASRDAVAAELTASGVLTTPGRWSPDALVVTRGAAQLRALPAYAEGRCTFQGEASQLVTEILDPGRGGRVLDACAAPGGKATDLAARVGADGFVLAIDPRMAGARRIVGDAARLGAAALRVAVGDARHPPLRAAVDAVLVDAPCSGLGTLRRHPELRWRRRPEDIARLSALQRELLGGVADVVRPGGTLTYAVCTLAREENEDVVADFLARDPRFDIEPVAARLPADAHDALTREGCVRTLPHRHGLDGFFIARLRRA